MPISLSRRRLLKLSAGSLLAASLWPGALRAADPNSDDFNFIVINDLHFTDENCGPFFEALVKELKESKTKCDFCILDGDLSESGTPAQLAAIRDLFKALSLPIHVVIGNHDWKADNDRKPFEDLYPKSYNYTFEHKGWQFVGLDTSHGRGANIACMPATIDYANETLAKIDKKKPLILFTHFPLGPRVVYRLKNAEPLLDQFKEHNLQAIFNGHFHGYTERDLGKDGHEMIVTTNKCCSFRRGNHDQSPGKAYFIAQAKEGHLKREYIEFQTYKSPTITTAPATKQS